MILMRIFVLITLNLYNTHQEDVVDWNSYIKQIYLDAHSRNIRTLNGLELFTNLTMINLMHNKIMNIKYLKNMKNLQ